MLILFIVRNYLASSTTKHVNSMPRDIETMRNFQREIAGKVVIKDVYKTPIISVGGIDMAFLDDLAIVAYVAVDYDFLEVKSKIIQLANLDFPYIPTLLSFREGQPIIDLINSVKPKPEVFLINAHGIAHPILCGCASHVGVLANVPTIGVASENLCGIYCHEPEEEDEYVSLSYNGKPIGWALKSKGGCRPIFISPGHRVSFKSSLDITMNCIKNHKFPEPLYLAHFAANKEKRRIGQLPGHSSKQVLPSSSASQTV